LTGSVASTASAVPAAGFVPDAASEPGWRVVVVVGVGFGTAAADVGEGADETGADVVSAADEDTAASGCPVAPTLVHAVVVASSTAVSAAAHVVR